MGISRVQISPWCFKARPEKLMEGKWGVLEQLRLLSLQFSITRDVRVSDKSIATKSSPGLVASLFSLS